MSSKKGFTIEISSPYGEWWRYNTALMCGCFDESGERIGFVSTEEHIADVGANLTQCPSEYPSPRITTLNTEPCHHLLLYIYIVPHTLPSGKEIASTRPFPVDIRIYDAGQEILTQQRMINQWSGASIELKIDKP